jgi:hypothetical protein
MEYQHIKIIARKGHNDEGYKKEKELALSAPELKETLKEVYDRILVEHMGYTGNRCDCDPSVGMFGCTVCRVRAALNIGGE